MVNPPSPDSEIDLAAGKRRLGADRLRHRVRHRAMPERTEQPPPAIHRQIARGPDRRQADIAGEDGVLCSLVADRLGDLLRMDEPLVRVCRPPDRRAPCAPWHSARCAWARCVPSRFCFRQRQQRRHRRPDVADHAEIDRRAAPDVAPAGCRPARCGRHVPWDRTADTGNRCPSISSTSQSSIA